MIKWLIRFFIRQLEVIDLAFQRQAEPDPPPASPVPSDWGRFDEPAYLRFIYSNGAVLMVNSGLIREQATPSLMVKTLCATGMTDICPDDALTVRISSEFEKAKTVYEYLNGYIDQDRLHEPVAAMQ